MSYWQWWKISIKCFKGITFLAKSANTNPDSRMPYYFVLINFVSKLTKEKRNVGSIDLDEETVKKHVAEPYMNDDEFMLHGNRIDPEYIELIRIFETDNTIEEIVDEELADNIETVCAAIVKGKIGKQVTGKFILHPPKKPVMAKEEKAAKTHSRNIFIVHGKADKPKLELARMLEELKFQVTILSEQAEKGRTIIEKLEQETIDVGYAFVILTPDDVGMEKELFERTHTGLCYRARQNVILELGYFVGKLGRGRVCCLYQGNVELPSDIHGVVYKKFTDSIDDCFKGIVKELKAAGYEVSL